MAKKSLNESVWDYPRPPAIESFNGHIRIVHNDIILVNSNKCHRILETSHPPSFYIPMSDVNMEYLNLNELTSFCEWKGKAFYFDLNMNSKTIDKVGWYYPNPNKKYAALKDTISFYASKLDNCFVNDEKVKAQEGDFYGGWITSNIKGPFKGGAGTFGW